MVVHAVAGGLPIEPRVYAAHALASLVPLCITTVLAVALQVIIGNRWLGMFAGLLFAYLTENGDDVGLEHLITRFGASPMLHWSDLDGFGSVSPSWIAFNALWALGSLVLIGAAAAHWPRGQELPFTAHVRELPARLSSRMSTQGRRAMLVTTGAFMVAYAIMVRETVTVARWESYADDLEWRAGYEQRYRRLQSVAQPQIVDADVDVALEPAHRRATVRGRLVVENHTARAIDTLWITFPRDAERARVRVAETAGDVTPTASDVRFGMYPVALPEVLDSGARLALSYSLTLDRSGLRADGFHEDVAGNGTFIRSAALMPMLGYQGRFEIADSTERAKRGLRTPTSILAPTDSLPALAARAREHGITPSWLTVRTTISLSLDQTALGPGDPVKEWTANGRRHFSYRLDQASTPMFAISAGRYAVERRQVGSIAVELWYHAAHGVQAARIVDIAARSLTMLQQQFGAYPHKTLRLIEVPSSWGFGPYALTGSIYLTESRGMLSDAREGDVDLLVRRVGHEVAHQLWGHMVDPLMAEGRLTMVETLAKYSEQLLLGQEQGEAVLARMMAFDHDRYLSGRANTIGLEPTLLTTVDESHMYYGKGALAFHALRPILGDSSINAALRTLLARERGPRGAASAPDLYALLRDVARDDDARAAVQEWFAERVIYDLVADSATVEQRGDRARVVAQFRVQRVRSDSLGEHTASANGALVTVGIYGGTTDEPRLLHTVRRRVADGAIAVDTTVVRATPDRTPTFVEIDPGIRLIDRDRSNNRLPLRSPAFRRLARAQQMQMVTYMLKAYLDNVRTYLTCRITNAVTVALNAKIQWIRYVARGHRNREAFKMEIYFRCGGMVLEPQRS